jgi:hypothetical protein
MFSKKVVAVLVAGLFSMSAFAGQPGNGNNGNNGQGDVDIGISTIAAAAVHANIENKVTSSNINANTNLVKSSNVQGQIQEQGQKQSTENSNNSEVNVAGDNFEARRIPVNTAFAPSIAPTANCALSTSGGVSLPGISASFGKAYIDENCSKLEAVRNVALVLKDTATAEAMMCQDKAYAKARATAGRACPVEVE